MKLKIKFKQEEKMNSPPRRKARRGTHVTVIELDDDGEIVSETTRPRNAPIDISKSVPLEE